MASQKAAKKAADPNIEETLLGVVARAKGRCGVMADRKNYQAALAGCGLS